MHLGLFGPEGRVHRGSDRCCRATVPHNPRRRYRNRRVCTSSVFQTLGQPAAPDACARADAVIRLECVV